MGKVLCHWAAAHASRSLKDDYRISREERVAYRKQSKAEYLALREAGFREKYFQFEHKNEKESAAAKAKAEQHAAEWEAKTGIKMSVYEGSFL